MADRKQAGTKGRAHNNGLGLYKDHITGDDDADDPNFNKKPLSTVTNASNARRGKDFGSQFEMTDQSPSAAGFRDAETGNNSGKENGQIKLTEDKQKVLNTLNANWGMYDDSPEATKKENKGIRTGGNGMGGRKDTARHWGFNYEDDEPEQAPKAGKAEKSFWDF